MDEDSGLYGKRNGCIYVCGGDQRSPGKRVRGRGPVRHFSLPNLDNRPLKRENPTVKPRVYTPRTSIRRKRARDGGRAPQQPPLCSAARGAHAGVQKTTTTSPPFAKPTRPTKHRPPAFARVRGKAGHYRSRFCKTRAADAQFRGPAAPAPLAGSTNTTLRPLPRARWRPPISIDRFKVGRRFIEVLCIRNPVSFRSIDRLTD